METFTLLLSIVMLVFGILQIILFFKIWRMTNDVREIKNKSTLRSRRDIAQIILRGSANTSELLFDALYNDLYDQYEKGWGLYKSTIEMYQKVYQTAGIEFPSKFADIQSTKDFEAVISLGD